MVGSLEDVVLERLLLVLLALAVHLVGAVVAEAADVLALLGRLEEHVGADDVAVRELEAVAEGVVDVRLGGEVHDGVDLLGLEHVIDEVGCANVSLDEFVVLVVADDGIDVLAACAVIELVEVDDIVLRVFLHHTDDHVRGAGGWAKQRSRQPEYKDVKMTT